MSGVPDGRMRTARDPVLLLRALGGGATWAQLRPHCTQHAVRRALDRGQVLRGRRGLYLLPELPPARTAAVLAPGTVSHVSAAVEHGLALLTRPGDAHVTVPPHARPPRLPGVRWHFVDLPPEEARRGTTSVARTVLDCAATLPFAEGLAVADSALRQALVRPERLREDAELRRGPGARTCRRVASAADGDAANPFESALRATVLDAGVEGFVPQLPVDIGRRIRVYLADPARRIALEADSFTHHGGRGDLERDCRRYDELVRRGWLVLRYAWEHVMFERAWVAATVLDACAQRT